MAYLGVISDTHERLEATQEAYRIFALRGVERIVHCGDVYAEENLTALKRDGETRIPIDFVFGNVDVDRRAALREYAAIEENAARCFGEFGDIVWRGKRVFWTHGHLDELLEEAEKSGKYDLICCGHTHQYALEERANGLVILNPGAIKPRFDGPSCCLVDEDLNVYRIDV